jgi:tetratricopeptide (TPR) repeat protein
LSGRPVTIDQLSDARSLRERAVRSNSAGRPAEAAASLEAALALLDAPSAGIPEPDRLRERCNTLITLALSDFLLGGVAPARARLREARGVADLLDDDGLRARVAFQRATILGRGGDLAAAWDEMQQAISSPDAFTPREQCSVQINRGMLAFELSQPQLALEAFAEAARVAHAHGFVQQEQLARHNAGHALYLLGDLPRSLAVMAEAGRLDGDVPTARVQLDRARVMLEAGLVSDALEVLGSAVKDLEAAGQDQVLAEVELERARALRLTGRLEAAAAAAGAALEACERLGAVGWATKARLMGLLVELAGPADVPGRDIRAIAARADEVAERATALGDVQLARSAGLVAGEALLEAGDLDQARVRLDRLGGSHPGSLSEELDTAWFTASLHVAAGEPSKAKRQLSSAARRLGAAQAGSASLDLRTARAVHGVRLAALDLGLSLPTGSAGVLQTLERWRSATDRLARLGRPDDTELAVLTEQLRSVHAQLRADPDPSTTRDLVRRVVSLERQIRSRDWALSSSSEIASAVPVRVREGREALDAADRDLLWFFTRGDRLLALGVVQGRASVRDLMARAEAEELARRIRVDLRAAATRHLGPMSQAVWGSLRASVQRLDDTLVRPWKAARAGVVLVTCEELSALPWALLPSLAGRPVTIARSLTSFARRERPTSRDGGEGAPGTRVRVAVGPGLARGSSEGDAVVATWQASGAAADVARTPRAGDLVQALSGSGVVHVVAHGTHQPQSPLFSSLALHDGPVFAHELQPRGVGADHVVLSACEVGTTSFRPGEEQLGLAASMLSLGARSVVAAVAPVPDDVAAEVMTRHHDGLARGLAGDEALAAAVAASDPVSAAFLNLGGRWVPGRA